MMRDDYGNPPSYKDVFDSKDEEIDYLASQATYWFWSSEDDLPKARYYAERLAKLIDDHNLEYSSRNSEEWALVWDARGNVREAIRYADMTINKYKADLVHCDESDHDKVWFREDMRSLQDALFLQADRHLRLRDRENAKQRMIEAAELSKQYGVPLDDDELALLKDLAPDYL
jgi:hypothetical protein